METVIAQRLTELNSLFYQTFAQPFSDTRQRLQPGVRRVLESMSAQADILDIGCGNGEVWQALYQRGHRGHYTGLDFSPGLLEIAASGVPEDITQARFIAADLADPDWTTGLLNGRYDCITAFAVLHHLPGEGLRQRVLENIHELLIPDGIFILSVWQFLNSPRLVTRIQSWDRIGLHAGDVDPGDYLLDWRHGGSGLRYVHHFSPEELDTLAQASGFVIMDSFLSDGENNRLGLYQRWRLHA